eukprot:scaffold101295_cov58-Attheya_sp.AAC.9
MSPSPDLCDPCSLATSALVYLIVLAFSQILVGVICVLVKANVDPSFFSEFTDVDDMGEKPLCPSIQTTKRQALIDQATITRGKNANHYRSMHEFEYAKTPLRMKWRVQYVSLNMRMAIQLGHLEHVDIRSIKCVYRNGYIVTILAHVVEQM